MVARQQGEALRQKLGEEQFRSADSSPSRLSRPLPFGVAPQVLAVFSASSFALVLLFNDVPQVVEMFPERDLFVTRYAGGYSVPLRIFVVCFYLGFASAVPAAVHVKIRFFCELLFTFMLFCITMDLCNALYTMAVGQAMSLHATGIASGLAGFMIFAVGLLNAADMPGPVEGTLHARFKAVSFVTIVSMLVICAITSIWFSRLELGVVSRLRDIALLGGVSVGVVLFVSLLFFLLNVLAALQNIIRATPDFSPDCTIIIPAYNEAHIIAATIAATDLAAAHYRGEVTLVVIDNNSTDDTIGAARSAFADCAHLRCFLLQEKRKGKSAALNRGLDAVQTEYFARLDADTLLDRQAIALCFRHFGRPHVGAVGGLALPPGGGPYDGARLIEILLKLGYDQVAFGAADSIFGIPGMFACYRTAAAREAGGFAYGMNGEDTDISLRIGEAGYRLVTDPEAIFISEVPRTFAHLREQRHRWFRSIFHVTARNRHLLDLRTPSVRGRVIIPFMLANTARRAMAWPLLLFAINFVAIDPDPRSTIRVASVLALLLGAPMLNATIAIVVNLRFEALRFLPAYILFRMLRAYLTLEALLSMTFEDYAQRSSRKLPEREARPHRV